jgi:hypothetical protein
LVPGGLVFQLSIEIFLHPLGLILKLFLFNLSPCQSAFCNFLKIIPQLIDKELQLLNSLIVGLANAAFGGCKVVDKVVAIRELPLLHLRL